MVSLTTLITNLAQINLDEGRSDPITIPRTEVSGNTFADILSVSFGIAGAVALIIIVIAGMQFILSRGEPQKSAKARNAIIYAAVGLVISLLAFSIVRFVVRTV